MKKNDITAIKFLKTIENEKDKYILVNDLFICKRINEEVVFYVGDFLKAQSVLNPRKTAIVCLNAPTRKIYYNIVTKKRLNNVGEWVNLTIGFNCEPIEIILK